MCIMMSFHARMCLLGFHWNGSHVGGVKSTKPKTGVNRHYKRKWQNASDSATARPCCHCQRRSCWYDWTMISLLTSLLFLNLAPLQRVVNWSLQSLRSQLFQQLTHIFVVFTAQCYACVVLAMGLCPCLSVWVCVCLSQVSVLLKRLNTGSHKQNHTIAQGL